MRATNAELRKLLTLIYVEVMDCPPVQPMSADSYLPGAFLDMIRELLESDSDLPIEDVIKAMKR